MMLWFVFALMTAAAIFAVLWPLGRASNWQADASETAVYSDQLAELERDAATGLINPPEAAAARVEIGRRLLAAAVDQRKPMSGSSIRLRRVAGLVGFIGLPLVALSLYLPLGSPNLADFPAGQHVQTA